MAQFEDKVYKLNSDLTTIKSGVTDLKNQINVLAQQLVTGVLTPVQLSALDAVVATADSIVVDLGPVTPPLPPAPPV